MPTKRQIDLILKGRDEASAPISSITEKIRELNAEARHSGEAGLERVLKGGGFLGLATLAGEALDGMAEKFNALKEKLYEGEISAAQIPIEFAKGLPIIGGFVEAGSKLREFFDDDARYAAELTKESEQQSKFTEVQLAAMKAMKEESIAFEKSIREAGQAINNLNLEGPGATLAAIRDRLLNAQSDAPHDLQSGLEAIRGRRAKEIAELQKHLGDLQKNMPEQFETTTFNAGEGAPGSSVTTESEAWRHRMHQIEATGAQLNGLHKAQADDEKKFTEEFNAQKLADQQKAEAQMQKARDEAAKIRQQETQASEDEIAKLQASANQSRLRAQGRDREADLDALKQYTQEQQAVIDRATAEKIKKARQDTSEGPADLARIEQIQREADARKQALDAESAAKQAEINRRYEEQEAQFEQQRQDRLQDLREKFNVAALENSGHQLDAEKAQRQAALDHELEEIDRFYKEKIDRLRNATDAESKAKLQALLDQEQQERALAQGAAANDLAAIARKANLAASDYRRPDLISGAHLTGAGSALADQNRANIARDNKINEIRDFVKSIADAAKALIDAMNGPTRNVPSQLSS